jgi:hypothetical protein
MLGAWWLRDPIAQAIGRVGGWKMRAGKVELEATMFAAKVELAKEEQPSTVPAPPTAPQMEERAVVLRLPANGPSREVGRAIHDRSEAFFSSQAAADLHVGVIAVALEVERALRELAGQLGLPEFDRVPVPALQRALMSRGALATSTAESVKSLWWLRSQVSEGMPDELLRRVIDEGVELLCLIKAVPRERYVVSELVVLFEDEDLRQPVAGMAIRGVILEIHVPGQSAPRRQAYPTRAAYRVGTSVSWTWDPSVVVDSLWYQDGQQAARIPRSALFTGRELP